MATISEIKARVNTAVGKLVEADQKSAEPKLLTPADVKSNPWRPPGGYDGSVNAAEARTTDKFSQSVHKASALNSGTPYSEGGGPGGWTEKVLPAYKVSYGEMREVQSHLNEIVSRLPTDAKGQVLDSALDELPTAIRGYFQEVYGGSGRPLPRNDVVNQLATVIREAATNTVDWK